MVGVLSTPTRRGASEEEVSMKRKVRRHVAKMRRMSLSRRVAYLRSLPDETRHAVARVIAGGEI